MDRDFPGNSKSPIVAPQAPAEEPKRVIEPIAVNAKQRKMPMRKRFMHFVFQDETPAEMASGLAVDVLAPALRDMIWNTLSEGLQKVVYGEVRSTRGSRVGGSMMTNYQNRFTPVSQRAVDPHRGESRRARSAQDHKEIILESRAEAMLVLERMNDLIQHYEVASVSDLYNLVGIEPNFTDRKWGWDDVSAATVSRLRDGGHVLNLPRPIGID